MVIPGSGSEWIIKLGPITRTNQAANKEQAEEGVLQKISEDVKKLQELAKSLIPLLKEGAVCSGGGEPTEKEDGPEPQVVSYQLLDGKWFSIANSGFFGVKLVCKK